MARAILAARTRWRLPGWWPGVSRLQGVPARAPGLD